MARDKQDKAQGPTHVAHLIGSLQTGGAEKMLVNYIGASDKKRFRHTVICLTRRGDMAEQLAETGVEVLVHRVRLRRLPVDLIGLARWYRKHDVRIVHSHMFYASLWGRLAGLMAGVPVLVTTEHGKEPWKKWWHIKLDHFLSGKSFHHIAVSEDVREIRIARDRVDPDKITMIPNGVPIPAQDNSAEDRLRLRQEFRFGASQPVVGTVGRVVMAKDYPTMLEALSLARQQIPDLHWLQVGDGPRLEGLRSLARKTGLEDAITFAGRRTDISAVLAGIDIWAMTSVFEGLPVALLEAMAAGVPIVTTDAGGITDAVQDGVSALVVPARNPERLAAGMMQLWQDNQLAQSLVAAARSKVESSYSIDAVAGRIEYLYSAGLVAIS